MDIPQDEEGPSVPYEQTESGWEITVDTATDEALVKRLFGNDAGAQTLRIGVRGKVPMWNSGVGPKLVQVDELGLILATDMGDEDDLYGFHNWRIPWANIAYVHQYIET